MGTTENQNDTATVLVVDDKHGLADLYAAWLDKSYTTRTAYGGEEALDTIDEAVDIVLLDRRMPGLSGDKVLERIRERGYDCRVAMVTAVDPDFGVLELSFDEYLVKPLSKEDIHEVVDQMFARSTLDEQRQQLCALISKKAALEAAKSQRELDTNDEFATLETEIDDLKTAVDEPVVDLDDSTRMRF